MAEINWDQIHDMENEFRELQKLEIIFESDKSLMNKYLNKIAVKEDIYREKKELDKALKEIDRIIAAVQTMAATRGKVMSRKTMERFLDKADRAAKSQRLLDAIKRANDVRKQNRLELYLAETLKEKNILISDIELFKQRARIAGFTKKETLKQLVNAGKEGTGPINSFGKRMVSVEKAVLRREDSAREIEEYRKVAKPDEPWQWVTISVKPCPDCQIRAGKILSWGEWSKIGMPGDGTTICRSFCLCKLMPLAVSEDLFPDVKTFRYDKKKGVLTTASEFRKLDSNKAKAAPNT